MRVALIVYGSLGQRSGGYLYDRMLVRALRDAGDEVIVVSLRRRPFPAALLDNFFPLASRLARFSPDLILEDELCHLSLCWANAAIARRLRRPIIAIVHHLRVSEFPRDRLGALFERRYLLSLTGAIVNSRATMASVLALRGSALPCHLAFPGRDRLGALAAEDVVARARHPRPLRIVTVGNLEPRKNVETLICAAAQLPPGAWQLTIVGGVVAPRYAAALRRQARALGVEEAVQFSGRLADSALIQILRKSDVFAQPSWHEGFGIAALEAMGFGLPAIVSWAGGASEFVTSGENGFLVDPADVGGVAAALRALLDRERRLAMSLAALDRYNRHPTWKQSMEDARAFLAACH
ncbi:MAG: glycosyltransferase family 4 protein [Chloroflexota bacterium]|nr:glycosyltransferase family 4 protein [Dehalococcoidia bacterium]MDW8253198.1 glycosyltransferase family 4 protein [Chloroflexota bacterium]